MAERSAKTQCTAASQAKHQAHDEARKDVDGWVVMDRHMNLPKDLTAECRNAAGTGQVDVVVVRQVELLAQNAGGNCKQASNKSGKTWMRTRWRGD